MSDKDENQNRSLDQILEDIDGHIERSKAVPGGNDMEKPPKQASSIQKSFKYSKSQDKPAIHPFWIFIIVLLLVGILFFIKIIFTSKAPELPSVETSKNVDLLAPADSESGDLYKEERDVFKEGRKKLSSGDYDGIKDLDKIVKDSPTSPQAAKSLLVMASTYRYNVKDPVKAVEKYEEFLKRFPDHKRANKTRRYLIELLYEMGDTIKVEANIHELMNHTPSKDDERFATYFLKKNQ